MYLEGIKEFDSPNSNLSLVTRDYKGSWGNQIKACHVVLGIIVSALTTLSALPSILGLSLIVGLRDVAV
ncbi:hypothetical protein RHSIM_RhsimUnG0000900 [Rhododendron simsii]|uniref:Uncharacterized protein n=1 Tax=Rhododendron simsii TaxID=118357 RepID=A0A834FY71_RHOSS|nr:hypothetical protein RHSIM_RhsimUnG0000900 [Rhododendron simsii]